MFSRLHLKLVDNLDNNSYVVSGHRDVSQKTHRYVTVGRTGNVADGCRRPRQPLSNRLASCELVSLWKHSSAKLQSPLSVVFLCSCDKVYHRQEVRFLLYLLGQIVTWQYYPNPFEYNWPCTVINDHYWPLRNCPLQCLGTWCCLLHVCCWCWPNLYYLLIKTAFESLLVIVLLSNILSDFKRKQSGHSDVLLFSVYGVHLWSKKETCLFIFFYFFTNKNYTFLVFANGPQTTNTKYLTSCLKRLKWNK